LFITAQVIRSSVIAGSLLGSQKLEKTNHITCCEHDQKEKYHV